MTGFVSALRRPRLGLLAVTVAIALAACSEKKDDYVERPVEELYNEAMDLVDKEEYLSLIHI